MKFVASSLGNWVSSKTVFQCKSLWIWVKDFIYFLCCSGCEIHKIFSISVWKLLQIKLSSRSCPTQLHVCLCSEVPELARELALAGLKGTDVVIANSLRPQGGQKYPMLYFRHSAVKRSGNQCSCKMIIGEEKWSEWKWRDNKIETKTIPRCKNWDKTEWEEP